MITTFAQRRKAERIYNKYFSPDSEEVIDFNFFDTLKYYGAVDAIGAKELTKRFELLRENLYHEMSNFDAAQKLML